MLAVRDDLRLALDRASFARGAGLDPDPWQQDALRSNAPRQLYNCSRQSGKSTVAATMAVHTTLYKPGSLVLLLSPTLRQSGELFKKCLSIFRAASLAQRSAPAESVTALTLTLENGSRIVSLPGKEQTVRGFSGVHLLVIDEAARVANDLYASARPMLAVSGGRLLALSTPFGTRGWWYEAWENGGSTWERYKVLATEVPRISEDFLEEERRTLGEWWYEQEYMCRFLDAETQAFRREDIDRAFEEEVQAWEL
jgi:hypothetical protein